MIGRDVNTHLFFRMNRPPPKKKKTEKKFLFWILLFLCFVPATPDRLQMLEQTPSIVHNCDTKGMQTI